jgi:hypothetical protein
MATIDLDLMQNLEYSSCLNEKAQVGGRGLEEARIDTWLSPVIEQSHDPSPSLYTHPNTICDKDVHPVFIKSPARSTLQNQKSHWNPYSDFSVPSAIPWVLKTRGVSHCGLAIYIKKYLKAKEEVWKFKYFTMQKYNLQKKSSQNPSRYHNSITNFKFQRKPKYHLLKILI